MTFTSLKLEFFVFTKEYFCSAHGTRAVHGILLAQPPETRLTEHVATRIHLEGFMEHVETDGADKVITQLGQLRLSIQQLLYFIPLR